MDNLSHSLVGLLCAEGVVRARERRGTLAAWPRSAVYAVAIIGNNLPDLDFSYSRVSGETFGYLLQHRGYTHTLPAVFGFALAILAVLALLSRWRRQTLPSSDWWLLGGVALVSPLLHLVLDFANNYGVHPFWPLHNGWYYGDSLFIVEPSLWLVIIAPLSLSYRSPWLRGTLWLILAIALGALWYRPFVPRGHALALSCLSALLLALARKQSPAVRVLVAAFGFTLLGAAFIAGSRAAKAIVRERAQREFPGASTLDVVATPMPANPFCWGVLLLQRDAAEYSVRLGRVATFPAWLTLSECPFDRDAAPSAPLQPLSEPRDAKFSMTMRYRIPLAELQALSATHCEARAFLRFARVPYLTAAAPDGSRVLGDLRYDRKPGLDFSDFRIERAQGVCPPHVPPWQPPRSDILSSPGP